MSTQTRTDMPASSTRASGWLLVAGLFAAIGGAIWMALPEPPAAVNVGDQRSEFRLPDVQGVIHTLPQGEVVLLNFWATWCPPCRQEIPSMAALHDRYAERGLHIVAVSVDQRSEDLVSFMQEYRMPFQVLHDADSAVSRSYGVFRYPESFLIDRNGTVVEHLIGAVDWMSAPILRTIDGMLAQPATAVRGEQGGDNREG